LLFMTDTRLSIRLDLSTGDRVGPGKIGLLEAIKDTGSISAAARRLGMSYRRAWLLVEEINASLHEPAVVSAVGGRKGGGAQVTPNGERVIAIYRAIESIARDAAKDEFRAMTRLTRKQPPAPVRDSTKRPPAGERRRSVHRVRKRPV
jgi:molybdate transport system regulatory protein